MNKPTVWKEVKLTKKDKENYKKLTGIVPQNAFIMKNKYWKLLNKIRFGA